VFLDDLVLSSGTPLALDKSSILRSNLRPLGDFMKKVIFFILATLLFAGQSFACSRQMSLTADTVSTTPSTHSSSAATK